MVAEVRLADLMEAMDDSFHLAECNKPGQVDICSLMSFCPVRGAIAEVHQRIREVLSNVTLAQLFQPASSPIPIMTGQTQFGLAVSAADHRLVTTAAPGERLVGEGI
jgi:DNA-binding IscR family transcriptional regulator